MEDKEQKKLVKAINRRSFIRASSMLGLGAFLTPPTVLGSEDDTFQEQPIGCDPTTDDIQGPFYLPGAPTTTLVASANEPGTRLYISGKVLSNDCATPIPNAMIEVWQANDAAVYDNTSTLNLRGIMYTDANGNYAFETIKPGPYLNGGQFRPSHIHYKISKLGFPTLVTQLYFQGDPYIANDPWASDPDAVARIISLNPITAGEEGVFDIVLDGSVGIKPNKYGEDGDIRPPFPNPSSGTINLHFNVFRKAKVAVIITDMEGAEINRVIEDPALAQGRYTVQWNGTNTKGEPCAPGLYLATLYMEDKVIKSQRILREAPVGYGR